MDEHIWKIELLYSGLISETMFWQCIMPLSVDLIFDEDERRIALISIKDKRSSEEDKKKDIIFIKKTCGNVIKKSLSSFIGKEYEIRFNHGTENDTFEKFQINGNNNAAYQLAMSIAKGEREGTGPYLFTCSPEYKYEMRFLLRAMSNFMKQNMSNGSVCHLESFEFWKLFWWNRNKNEIPVFSERVAIVEDVILLSLHSKNVEYVEYKCKLLADIISHNEKTLFVFHTVMTMEQLNNANPILKRLINSWEQIRIE